jgi:NitT/TauT family transport system permease protein
VLGFEPVVVPSSPLVAGQAASEDPSAVAQTRRQSRSARLWASAWPQLGAAGLVVLAWQLLVWTGWRPEYVLPGPVSVFSRLFHDLRSSALWMAIGITLERAAIGYLIATVVGSLLGVAMVRIRILRAAMGSLITGLQSMPSVAWFPLAILFFRLSEAAILFVVVLGAAPAIANGLLAGVDHIQPLVLRAGRVLGARGVNLYTRVLFPAALPGFVAGLKQGWAFAWRSLMAGELLVIIGNSPSLGVRLQFAREFSDAQELLASMVVVLVIGVFVDSVLFGSAERTIRAHRGLIESGR